MLKRINLLVFGVCLTSITAFASNIPCSDSTHTSQTATHNQALSIARPCVDRSSQVAISNAYSLRLLTHDSSHGNNLMSPFSVLSAFSLLYPGTSGELRTNLYDYFSANISDSNHCNNGGNLPGYAVMPADHTLFIANSMWVDRSAPVKTSYQSKLRKTFHAEVHTVNFSHQNLAAKKINHWVANKTHGFVPVTIKPKDIKGANFALINAIYFHGVWEHPFQKSATVKQSFYTRHDIQKVNMMHQRNHFDYYSNKDLQMISLPYTNNKYDMVVILPKRGETLEQIKKKLSISSFSKWSKQLAWRDIDLSLPKFNYSNKLYLKKMLMRQGLTQPFKYSHDFSGITNQRMKLDKVIQMAKISVDEQGTKAAASTVVIGNMTAIAPSVRPKMPIVFNADHPFIYMIRQRNNGLILFAGVEQPPGASNL
jgi:serpin B